MKYTKESLYIGFIFTAMSTSYQIVSLDVATSYMMLKNLNDNSQFSYSISGLLTEVNKGNWKVKQRDYEIY